MEPNSNDLYGWQLNNPDRDIFDVQVMEVFGECQVCEHSAGCTVPCESVRRLVPKEGTLVVLGHQKERGKPRMSYFALLNRDDVKFIQLTSPDYSWAKASCISQEMVPPWALSRLDQEREGLYAAASH